MKRRNLIIAPFAFLIGLVGAVVWLREPTVPLTHENLADARERWRNMGLDDYTILYRMNRDSYEIEVSERIVVDAAVNGTILRSDDVGSYSIEGMFRLLDMELENLHDPGGPFAGRGGGSILARVRYNREFGYVERYVRSSGGMGTGAEIEVLEFRPTVSNR